MEKGNDVASTGSPPIQQVSNPGSQDKPCPICGEPRPANAETCPHCGLK